MTWRYLLDILGVIVIAVAAIIVCGIVLWVSFR
jgi:hypothetical protein